MDQALATLYSDHIDTMLQRHRMALQEQGFDWLIIHSGLLRYEFLDDRPVAHVANPHFRTWVPLPDHAGGAVIVGVTDSAPRLVFLQPRDYWHEVPATPAEAWARHFDLRAIAASDDIVSHIADLEGRVAVISDTTAPASVLDAGEHNPQGLIAHLHWQRAVKTGYEIECMRRANAIAVRGHRAAEQAFRDGASEFDIHIAYCKACGQDTNTLPYDNIVALNEHGAILHYTARENHAPAESRAFLIDAGASYNGYAADITRTYSRADDDFAALIALMDELQLQICADATAGTDYVSLHRQTHDRLGLLLEDQGLVKCSAEAAVAQGYTRAFFPHGLGHYIGTQVHDVGGHQANIGGDEQPPPPDHPFLRLTRELEAGAVCTIEPGLYIIDMLLEPYARHADLDWAAIDRLRPYGGIRIEDDVHVTSNGVENLTRDQFAAY
ncbi:MAG: Xaa-Pro dipeptidase [Gammaproteobacteria bacterium]|nr:Xaa-Pro dipeptidase [Gammaproteobacteria bacterium]